MSETVFVSYSHEDDHWREIFQKALGRGVYQSVFQLWIDRQRIETGEIWRREIDEAIARSSIALVLVSAGFLGSDYIHTQELPKLLRRHHDRALSIFWVPLREVDDETLRVTQLLDIQAAWPLSNPLSTLMEPKELEDALLHIGSGLIQKIKLHRKTSDALRDQLKADVAGVVREISLGDSFAGGDYSIFFKAKHEDADVVVKALVPSPGRQWLRDGFVDRAVVARQVSNSTAINIRHVYPDPRMPCVVMDHVTAPTLNARLAAEGKLSSKLVAKVIAQLVRLAGHLHAMKGGPILGPVRPSHVHYDNTKEKAFISLIPIANETLETCREYPTRLHDSTTLPYISPERYSGRPIDGRADQYHLGLLALELLQGGPPVKIKAFVHLTAKTQFFESPRSYFDKELRLNDPAFSFVLARMLEREPKNRWASTAELVRALEDIGDDRVPETVSKRAGDQYDSKLWNNARFYGSFYRILKKKDPKYECLFKDVSMRRQYRMLDRAIADTINFALNRRTATLRPQADKHRNLGLLGQDFEQFRDAFLEALSDAGIDDETSKDAWRAVLGPALKYMRDPEPVAAMNLGD
jgi:serine/threonine protein kinase